MKIENFFGNKLGICTKEELDNLTVEQMEGVDTAFCVATDDYQFWIGDYEDRNIRRIFLDIHFLYKNKDLSQASLCLNACFLFLKKLYENDLLGVYSKKGEIEGMDFAIEGKKILLIIDRKNVKTITTLSQATLYDIGNQHWVCKKGNTHNIPKDKSVNVHEYYDVVEKEGYVECTVDFFERGVGKTQACGSGAFCVGMHLFKIHGKEVVVKTENGDKYFVNENTISVEI